tara:strand:+ start:98 stop:712 length:615 start_codon:yes stop_codon:yes gene_type:complete
MQLHFEEMHRRILEKCNNYPIIKNEIAKNGIVKIKTSQLDFFSFVFKTIISQQISDKAAESIWKKICDSLGTNKLSIKNFKNDFTLRKSLNYARVSNRKIEYICSIYQDIRIKKLKTIKLIEMNEIKFKEKFSEYKGVGPWTCDIILIFFFQKLNILPKGDLIINKMMLRLKKLEKKEINFKKEFSPFLSIFSLHLWKMSKRVI